MSFYLIDLHHEGEVVTVQWEGEPHNDLSIDASVIGRINALAAAFTESLCNGEGGALAAHDLGAALFCLLDGPQKELTQQLKVAECEGAELHVVIRLTTTERGAALRHPALRWHLHLTAPPEGPLARMPLITFTVQIGDGKPTKRESVPDNRLKLLFMGYSPPELELNADHDGDMQRIADELAPFIECGRLAMDVVEDGSLSELRRQLMSKGSPYDIIHLAVQGVVADEGPRIVMGDVTGAPSRVSAEELIRALEAGPAMPRLLMLSMWHSIDPIGRLWEIFGELIQRRLPTVVFWLRPIETDDWSSGASSTTTFETTRTSPDPAKEFYHRLCVGDTPTQALAHAHRWLLHLAVGLTNSSSAHTWTRLGMLTRMAAAFSITASEPSIYSSNPQQPSRFIAARMSAAGKDFVGRRRELRILRQVLHRGEWTPPGSDPRMCAGAIVVGARGQGKSSLVRRLLVRNQHISSDTPVVIRGTLDERLVLLEFQTAAKRLGDNAAEEVLGNEGRTVLNRIERLLRNNWRARKVAVVFDDFENNVEIRGEGEARLKPFVAALLEVLVPVCRDEEPKLFVTTTARFELLPALRDVLADVPLGSLDSADVRKLWMRGKNTDLRYVGMQGWVALCDKLDRNPWMLEKARGYFRGKELPEVQLLLERIPQQLIEQYRQHVLTKEVEEKISPDAMTFIDRVRAYDAPTFEALGGLTEGLTLSRGHIIALANFGLLVVDTADDRTVYRANPLIEMIRAAVKPK